jgi:hypothetical protein
MVNAPFAVLLSILVSPAEDSNPFVRIAQDFSKKPKRGHPFRAFGLLQKNRVFSRKDPLRTLDMVRVTGLEPAAS